MCNTFVCLMPQVTPNSDGSKDISLVVLERLDREEESSYAYKITASDGGDPVLSASMVVQITVTGNYIKYYKATVI